MSRELIKELLIFILAIAPITAALATNVWVHERSIVLSYKLRQLRHEQAKILSEINELELQLAKLKKPRYLSSLAKLKLRQHPPRPGQILKITQGTQNGRSQ